jgi:arylsulfatase A-like enzyme
MMGDHGLYWKGPYTYNGCTNIPTIVSAPGLPGGLVSNALTSQIDLFPSILDYCSVDLPGAHWSEHKDFAWGQEQDIVLYPGKSWRPVLEGRKKLHDEIIIENDYLSTGFKARCMVTDNFRITIYPGTDDGELFDVKKDPGEMVNLWYKPQYENLKLELLRQMLDAYSRNTPHYPIPPWNS